MKKADRQALALLGVLVCALIVLWAVRSGGDDGDRSTQVTTSASSARTPGALPTARESTTIPPSTSATSSTSPEPAPSATPTSGLDWIAESELPEQGRHTLALIRAGGPYPYRQDDGVFGNREGLLPQQRRGYYREYTVETPGSDDRGARRIVGGDDGDRYYTDDHYDSFRQIEEGR